ncbi:MAG: flagellar biosynthesis protein FlhA [Acidobacteria bacterium SCN 69-37]|nr:MAG: flagellar biosynthesis protein FlhA [Acidobacteria bacterium SCN 69-37]
MSTQAAPFRASFLIAPAAIIAVVLLMIVPLPTFVLDLLLSIDIGLAVVLLFTAIYVRQPTEFSVFPSLLLLLTLLRLALNVASTRLVLLHGHEGVDAAGHVIMAFGQFVVGGNFVVGVVVFLVLVAIQFLVINHGAVRISEVTARFTLDAMPGRQMAIDADLNAGIITDQEARARRERLRGEADFYGAMDGAIRFTQRDSLAAVLITGVNIVAGLIIGVAMHGVDLTTALQTYTILTVGEGLVTAIPALLVSMAGGLITTRAAAESNLGEEVAVQLLARSRPLAVAAGVLVALALVPGLPKASFLFVALVLGGAAWANRRELDTPDTAAPAPGTTAAAGDQGDPIAPVDPLGIEVGYALVSLVDETRGGTLLNRVRAIRRQIATETGLLVPPVHVSDNLQLGPRVYAILVKGVEVARGELYTDRLLAINPGTVTQAVEGIAAREPAFGLPAVWVAQDRRDQALAAGYTVVDPTTAVSTHLSEVVRTFLPDLLTRQQTKDMIDRVGETAPKLVEELVPKIVSVGDVQRVLKQLLRERVPVRDLMTILEALADAASVSKDPDVHVESVRTALGRSICRSYQGENGELAVLSLSPTLEDALVASLTRTDRGAVLALDPNRAQALASRLAEALATEDLAQPVLLCSPMLRPHLWRLFSRALPHIAVLSHAEIPAQVRVVSVATLD